MDFSNHFSYEHITDTPIKSTQDEARRLLKERYEDASADTPFLAVQADIQLHGRGTQGRTWERGVNMKNGTSAESDGNLYITLCVPMARIPVTITLLPIQIGVLVTKSIRNCLRHNPACANISDDVTVKWPNDVLIQSNKVSGTLIESEIINGDVWFLIGIGINVQSTPTSLQHTPGQHKRAPTCIQEHCRLERFDTDNVTENTGQLRAIEATRIGHALANGLYDWVYNNEGVASDPYAAPIDTRSCSASKEERDQDVLYRYRELAKFGTVYELRGQLVEDERNGSYEGERVTTVDIADDGRLLVRDEHGNQRALVAEYLF